MSQGDGRKEIIENKSAWWALCVMCRMRFSGRTGVSIR